MTLLREGLNSLGENIRFSNELAPSLDHLSELKLAPNVPDRLQPLLDHLTGKVESTLQKMDEKGNQIEICGPDWARANPQMAGVSHAEVIIAAYGSTYALPNKNPEENVELLNSGKLDMYLIFENKKPVGTACTVIQDNGWAELGRSASLGRVGNQVIQDLRIIRWLTEEAQAEKIFGLFSTCRTAPDREVGTKDKAETMRGGQAVTNMWSQFPEVMVGGFGPLYKKHGALEQFAYAFMTNREAFVPVWPQVARPQDRKFIGDWAEHYEVQLDGHGEAKLKISGFSVHYPPLESKLTEFIHGEITLEGEGESFETLDKAISRLNEVEVPFIQVQVPVDVDSRDLQNGLLERGFQAFLFTPAIKEKQPPLLWFGKVSKGVSVVPTFWQQEGSENPFWTSDMAAFASQVAVQW